VKRYLSCLLQGIQLTRTFDELAKKNTAVVDVYLKHSSIQGFGDLAKKSQYLGRNLRALGQCSVPTECLEEAKRLEGTLMGIS
jgi:hypothetical protein